MLGRLIVIAAVLAAFLALTGNALAADPHGGGSTGQPSQSCEDAVTGPLCGLNPT
jgi:hypothetical protein